VVATSGSPARFEPGDFLIMPLRRPRDTAAALRVSERLGKLQTRMYVLWALGISVGALELKPTSFSVLGASFVLAKPELIEGMLFLGCFAYFIVTFHIGVNSPYTFDTPSLRNAIFISARRFGNTLRGLSKEQRFLLKLGARASAQRRY
jgi:hypothetical protein